MQSTASEARVRRMLADSVLYSLGNEDFRPVTSVEGTALDFHVAPKGYWNVSRPSLRDFVNAQARRAGNLPNSSMPRFQSFGNAARHGQATADTIVHSFLQSISAERRNGPFLGSDYREQEFKTVDETMNMKIRVRMPEYVRTCQVTTQVASRDYYLSYIDSQPTTGNYPIGGTTPYLTDVRLADGNKGHALRAYNPPIHAAAAHFTRYGWAWYSADALTSAFRSSSAHFCNVAAFDDKNTETRQHAIQVGQDFWTLSVTVTPSRRPGGGSKASDYLRISGPPVDGSATTV